MKIVIFILLSLLSSSTLYSQDDNQYILNRTPQILKFDAPNAASFNKFIDNPISLYNGTPNVNIPIYTLKDGAIEIPIQLRYNTSGIKVNEEASWVGLGWNLNVGGVITRQCIGGIDKRPSIGANYYDSIMNAYDPNHIYTNTDFQYNSWSHQMRLAFDGYLVEPSKRKMPNEGRLNPDLFYLSYPEGSSKFIIDSRNDSVYIIERESDIKIESILGMRNASVVIDKIGRSIVGFKITLPNGVIHLFDYSHNVLIGSPAEMKEQTETYLLSKTIYPNGQEIQYEYDTFTHWSFIYDEQIQSNITQTSRRLDAMNLPYNDFCSYCKKILPTGVGHDFSLKSIRTTNYSVTFINSLREDLPDVRKLDEITIKDNLSNNLIKNFHFDYSYFTSSPSYNFWSYNGGHSIKNHRSEAHFLKRLKLLSVYSTMTGQNTDKYTFHYNQTSLPRKDSFATDYWGYYNGQETNKSFIPNLLHLMWHNSAEYENIKNMPQTRGETLPPALRAYNFESCKASILEGIQYPTGGYTEFVYEPHTFIDYIIPTIEQINDRNYLYEKTVKDNNSASTPPSVKVWSYKFSEDTYVDLEATIYRGDNSWESVASHQIQIAGSTTVDISMKSECLAMQKDWEQYHINKGYSVSKAVSILAKKGTAYFVTEFPDELGDQTKNKHGDVTLHIKFLKPEYKNKRENQGAGLRIKDIVFYDSPQKLNILQKTNYDYTDSLTQASSGILQQKLQFVNYYPETIDVLGKRTSSLCQFPQIEMMIHASDKLEIGGHNFLSTPYQSFSEVGYSRVKETKSSDNENAGYIIYEFNNTEPKSKEHSISIHDPLNGKLLKKSYYNMNHELVKREIYNYTKHIYHYYFGFNFYDRINLFPNILKESNWSFMQMLNMNDSFSFTNCLNKLIRISMECDQRPIEKSFFSTSNRLALVVHPLNPCNIILKSKTITQDGITTKEEYSYNPETLQLINKSQILPDNHIILTSYSYPNDQKNGNIYQQMKSKHIISPIIEKKLYEDGSLFSATFTEYSNDNNVGLILPSKQHYSEIDTTQEDIDNSYNGINKKLYPADNITYKKYDKYGNILEANLNDGIDIVYLWGYRGQYPVAEIKNATYEEVQTALKGMLPESLSLNDSADFPLINTLRTKLANAHVTTYKYQPLVGIVESISPSGYTTYYSYNPFGKLTRVYIKETDEDGNEVEKTIQLFNYHYRD